MRAPILFALFVLLTVTLIGCNTAGIQPPSTDYTTITLKWNKSYAVETQDSIALGLQWACVYLGAQMPRGRFGAATRWTDSSHIAISFSQLNFSDAALHAISTIIKELQRSDEYVRTGAIDVGRFMMLTVGSSNHYYAITGAEKSYADWHSAHRFDSRRAAILESLVSTGNRAIELPDSTSVGTTLMGFVSHEGSGAIAAGTFVPREFEVTQLMPNGMFRFAVYDSLGNLMTAADSGLSSAGKPAKCVWCHELGIQPTFAGVTQAPPTYYSFPAFDSIISYRIHDVDIFRETLIQDVDYSRHQQHRNVALQYVSFMEPSGQHLANEWSISEDSVKRKLSAFTTHRNPEYDWLGDLYDRNDVDGMSPFTTIRVPQSARDPSLYEPDFFR